MGVQINGDTGNISATKADYSGNVTIGGTLTYEDVTNIDSVGIITARSGIEIGARPGVGASISVDGNAIFSGITTATTLRAPTGIVTSLIANTARATTGIVTTLTATTGIVTTFTTNTAQINTTSLSSTKMAIQSTASSGSGNACGLRIGNNVSALTKYPADLELRTTGVENYNAIRTDAGDGNGGFTAGVEGYNGFLNVTTGGTDVVAAKIRSSGDSFFNGGDVAIGQTTADARLHVATPAATTCEIRLTSNNTGSNQGDRGRINVYSAKNDGTAFNAGYIDIDRASGTQTTAQMTFNLNNGSGVTEWARIEPTGRILAARNTSGDQGLSDPGVILDRQNSRVGTNSNTFNGVGIIKDSNGWGTALYIKRTSDGAGQGFFCEFAYATLATSGTTIGSISNNGNSNVAFNTSSDYRLKQDISSITDAISSLKKLTPRKFRWKNDLDLGYQDGFIAHEVQETGIFSHLVTGEKDGTEEAKNDPDTIIPAYQQMDYSKLTPTLVAAVQELSAEIESLKSEIAALKSS